MKHLLTRKTIRRYADRDVDDALLRRLLSLACRTQTLGNLQLYSVVVTRDGAAKKRLAPLHFGQPMVEGAPVVLTVCADVRRYTAWTAAREASAGFDNVLSLFNAATDALLFCQTFCNAAEAAGLGVCFLGTTLYSADAIIDELRLPRLVLPVATLTVGWPGEEAPLSDRLPLDAVVHEEHFDDYTAADIDAWYAAKEALAENRAFVAANGKRTLAQVFADCRYTRADNERMSRSLVDTLRRQGFVGDGDNDDLRPKVTEVRPPVLECDVVRFRNNKEKWVALVGLLDGYPYEIFTGLQDDDEGIVLPKTVTKGKIIKQTTADGKRRYDFQFENKRGYKTTVEGLSEKFNPEYWNYAKLISGVLRYRMPIDNVIKLVGSLQLGSENINNWKNGVVRALKKYSTDSGDDVGE